MIEKCIPKHIAIIMDGNGRWAKKRGLPRTAGHKVGAENVCTIAKACNKLGVKELTLYAFSTENWKRPEDEVNYLCKLPKLFFSAYIKELTEDEAKRAQEKVQKATDEFVKKVDAAVSAKEKEILTV